MRYRSNFTWYSGALFIIALLLAGAPEASAASDIVTPRDSAPHTDSSGPAIHAHSGKDVLQRMHRMSFAPAEPQLLSLFHSVAEFASTSPALRPTRAHHSTAHARAPPTHR